jgi:hypothetical protein
VVIEAVSVLVEAVRVIVKTMSENKILAKN